jgi:hypothetical protein
MEASRRVTKYRPPDSTCHFSPSFNSLYPAATSSRRAVSTTWYGVGEASIQAMIFLQRDEGVGADEDIVCAQMNFQINRDAQ